MSDSMLVTLDEFNTEITPNEYSAFLEREKERSYINEATLRDGVPVDVDEYILKGAEILVAVSTGV
jgi:hypothetical protein